MSDNPLREAILRREVAITQVHITKVLTPQLAALIRRMDDQIERAMRRDGQQP